MSAPAIAQDPTPSPTATTPPPSTPTTPTDKALAQAKKDNRRVEIEPLRSESATYYANPDGKTVRMEMHTQPIRVKDADGKGFAPIDTTLVEADGSIKPKVAKGDLVLSAGRNKTLLKSRTADATAKIATPSALPEPKLNGNTATYPDAYGKGRDLVVTANPTGFRQQITIAERPTGPVSFRVPVDLPSGLSFKKNAADQPLIVSKDGKTLTEVRPTLLQDATASDAGAPIDAGKIGKAAVTLGEDGKTLVFTPDTAFLADPAVTYPVTMTAAADDWWETDTSESNGMDTFINDVDYQDSWAGFTLDRILAGKSYASNVAKRWRSYLKFPDVPDEFAGSTVENADLILWNHLSNDCGPQVGSGITARQITSFWDETSLHWDDQPSVTNVGADTEYGAYSPDCSGSMAYEWDLIHSVDDIVQAWVDGETNYGIRLTAGNESDLRNWRRYRTYEAGGCTTEPREECKGTLHPPILTVDFKLAKKPQLGVLMLDAGESFPATHGEFNQLVADGRVGNTLPEPEPVSHPQAQDYLVNSDQDYVAPPEEVETPLPPPEDEVTARWSFDEGSGTAAADSSGNNHHATVNDGIAWTPGVSTSALTNVGVSNPTAAEPIAQSLLPARVIASRKAAVQGVKVEVPEETTETSITYADPGGKSFTTEVRSGPVRTKRNGTWIPIDTTLSEQGGILKPKAMVVGATLEISSGGMDPFVTMTADGRSYALSWPTPLPKPTVKGSVATYTDAAGVGADLVVTVLPTGFRHDVVLRQRPSKPLELRIGVQTGGLTLSEGKGGRLLLTAGKGKKPVASAPQPVMWDASAKGRRLPKARHAKIATDVVTKDGRTELVLKPDHAFLTDPATTYPVRVDPTTTLPFNDDIELYSEMDAGQTADPTLPYMLAGRLGSGLFRVHLRFDTTALAGTTVTDAKLSLLNIDAPTCGPQVGAGIQVRRLTSAWDENNLHWANKPTSTTEDAQINRAACEPTPMQWPVTAIAQDWAGGAANHGLVLQHPNEANTSDNYRLFPSSEETDFNSPPTLTITTSGPASTPTLSGLGISPAQNVDGTTVATSLIPQLSATVADAIGGTLTGEFEVEHDPAAPAGQGSGQIWAGSSSAVASGTQTTVAVPAGKLADGWMIRWRARAVNGSALTNSAWTAWQLATVDVPNPTVNALQVTPAQVVDGTTTTTSLTPALHATANDPAGQPLRVEYEVDHDPAATGQGSGQIWTSGVDNVASGAQATITVPVGMVTDGWKIRWRARAVNAATTVSSPWAQWQNLTIDIPDPVSEPTVGALQVTPSTQVDGKTITNTLTPALLAQVNDAVGGNLRGEFEIEHDPAAPAGQGTGQIWIGGVDNVPAGTQANLSVPADKLTHGWLVRWRARAVSASAASPWSGWQHLTVNVPSPTVTNMSLTPSVVIDGTVTTTLIPTLKATFTHPDGQSMRAEFEIEHDPAAPAGQGTGQIWAGALDNVGSDTIGELAVPPGELTEGWKVRWRVRAVTADRSSDWVAWQQVTVKTTLLEGGPFAQTNGSVLSSGSDFTVAAWLRVSDKDGTYTVLEQRGVHQAPFHLGNDPEHGLVFTFTSADDPAAAVEGVRSAVEPPVDKWFHVAATYTNGSRMASLYLNGQSIGSTSLTFTPWHASSAMTLGTAITGTLDEVWVYGRELLADEVFALMDGSAVVPEASDGDSTARIAADPPWTYDRINAATCKKDWGGGKREYGLLKNRFSGCFRNSVFVYEPDESDQPADLYDNEGGWQGSLMFIAKTYSGRRGIDSGATTRDIWFEVYMDHAFDAWDNWGAVSDVELTVGMSVASNQSSCKHITSFNGDPQRNNITKTMKEWFEFFDPPQNEPKHVGTFRFRAAPGDAPLVRRDRSGADVDNTEKISNCVFDQYAKISHTEDAERIKWVYGAARKDAVIRCDTADSKQVSRTTGGCILPVIPSIEWRMGRGYDKATTHYWKACYDKLDTFPKNPAKIIHGCAINGTNRPPEDQYLWRVGPPRKDNSNGRAVTRCRSLWPSYGNNSQDCDEYPFQSAGNRTAEGDKAGNLSVCAMSSDHNQIAGNLLGRLYNNDRILYEDVMFNRFPGKPVPLPRMEDLCWPGNIDEDSSYYDGVG
ncbi:DNRLRE domain-containing protein [Nonomuraea sp. ZG12]|uniref:DNRLRE domain-containing protein n=1 Tax=Nonomuraea sp. ZG12 TaxID=3452207 RepID=UPI003F896104